MENTLIPKEAKEAKEETISLYNPVTRKLEFWNPYSGEMVGTSIGAEVPADLCKAYSLQTAQAISAMVREGASFPKISRMVGMPSLQALYFWKRRFPEFARLIKEAREDRADLLVEKYLQLVDDLGDMEEGQARGVKHKIDAWKWAAEKLAPKEYGTVKEKENNTPTQINIYTGIVREDPVTVVVTNKEELGDE